VGEKNKKNTTSHTKSELLLSTCRLIVEGYICCRWQAFYPIFLPF